MALKSFTVRFHDDKHGTLELQERSDLLVVRTHSGKEIRRTHFSQSETSPLKSANRLAHFPAAGVEVIDVGNMRSRNHYRKILKDEADIRFAGRVLTIAETNIPVLYTENFYVKFPADQPVDDCLDCLKAYNLELKESVPWAPNAFFAAAQESTGLEIFGLAEALESEKLVKLCHPELVTKRSRRAASDHQWHLKEAIINGNRILAHANVENAWANASGAGTVIAVLDDGFDIHHEEFQSPNKIVAPLDLVRGTTSPIPGPGDHHGTACAGVACANGHFEASGVAPEAQLMPIRLPNTLGGVEEAEAFYHAATNGAHVINCSWGPPDGDPRDPNDPLHNRTFPLPPSTRDAIDYAVSHGRGGKGCFIAWAAGNGAEPVDNDGYASHEEVIAVAASNDTSKRSGYSDFGDAIACAFPSDDLVPSLTPGIWTTDRTGASGYNPGSPLRGDLAGNYVNHFGGTSSAAPGVAGLAALILSVNPDLSLEEVRNIIFETCDKIDFENGSYQKGHSPLYGYGRVNAANAVNKALSLGGTPRPLAAGFPLLADRDNPLDHHELERPLRQTSSLLALFESQTELLRSQNELLGGVSHSDSTTEGLLQNQQRFFGLFGGRRRITPIPLSRRLSLPETFAELSSLIQSDFNRDPQSIRPDSPLVGGEPFGQTLVPIAGSEEVMTRFVERRVNRRFSCRPALRYPQNGFRTVGQLAQAIFQNRNAQ